MNSPNHLTLLAPHHHHEVLQTFAQLAMAADYKVSIFTNVSVQACCISLKDKPLQWYIQKEGRSFRELLVEEQKVMQQTDLYIFITLLPTEAWVKDLKWSAPKLMIVHNGYTFWNARNHQVPTLEGWLRRLRAEWKGRYKVIAQLLDSVDFISLPDEGIQRHLLEKYPDHPANKKLVDPLPFTLFDENLMAPRRGEGVTIVVPGTVSVNNRDYQILLGAFKKLVIKLGPDLDNLKKLPIQLVFLGQIRGSEARRVCNDFKRLESRYFSFLSFDHLIPQEVYEDWIKKSDFLILPLRAYFDYGPVREYYGLSNTTGTINDMIRFGKPAILPDFYPLPDYLEIGVQRFTSEEQLLVLLEEWIKKRIYKEKETGIREACKAWSLEALLPKFSATIRSILDSC